MKYLLTFFSALFLITLSLNPVWSEGNVFGLLGKNKDDLNFKSAAEGCIKQAAENNDICLHIGPGKFANPRSQILPLKKAIEKKDFSAAAISVPEFHDEFRNKKFIIAPGVGKILSEYQKLLDDGLIHGFVSINFKQTGKLAYEPMKDAADGKPIPETTYV
jgi:hypothetical protein